jgi:Tfp pilus assembly protein PilF
MTSRTACFWRHALVSALAIFSSTAHALTPSQVFEAVKDSVVVVKTFDSMGDATSQGSGVLLPSGRVATNCHVIKDGASFQAGRGKRFVAATVYAADGDKDICLLEAKGIGGKPATLGKASSLKVGVSVYAVGAPKGLELSLSDGIVSQLRGSSPPFIQTTAAISPGSSGGGLFDSEARLVGFTTLYIDGGQSLNFAMPVEWLAEIKPSKKAASQSQDMFGWLDWNMRAAALEKKGDWSGLLALDKQWLRAAPNSSYAWAGVGEAYENLNQPDQAIAAYRQALSINPKYAGAWGGLGNGYFKLKRYDDAIAAFRQALSIDPESAGTWYNLGLAYGKGPERWNDAVDAQRQALRIDPKHVYAWKALALTYYLSGNNTAALDAARNLRQLDPEKAEEVFNIIMRR